MPGPSVYSHGHQPPRDEVFKCAVIMDTSQPLNHKTGLDISYFKSCFSVQLLPGEIMNFINLFYMHLRQHIKLIFFLILLL